MAYKPAPGEKTAPFIAAASLGLTDAQLPAGWEAAQQLHRLKHVLGAHSPALAAVTEAAIESVISRARGLLRHAARPTRPVSAPWPGEGELDLELSLDAGFEHGKRRPAELLLTRREPRDAEVCAVLDMSLSMTGEKIALVAVAAAILRMKLENVSIVAFDTQAHRLVRVGERVPLREVVRRVLMVPAQGYTHIAAGLEAALDELAHSRRPEKVAILMSDGIANVGQDPVRVAGRFDSLHVVQIGRDLPQGTRACRGMAQAGHGRRFHAPTYVALPLMVKRLIREVFRV